MKIFLACIGLSYLIAYCTMSVLAFGDYLEKEKSFSPIKQVIVIVLVLPILPLIGWYFIYKNIWK